MRPAVCAVNAARDGSAEESSAALVDGSPATGLPFDDRGLAYGDGLFETVRFVEGAAPLWRGHMARLRRGCAVMRIEAPSSDALLHDASRLAGSADCVIKLIVTRTGGRGYFGGRNSRRIVIRYALPAIDAADYENGVAIRWCRLRLSQQPLIAGLKHLNRLEQVMARSEWSDARIREGLLCDADDRVACATAANVFVVRNGQLITPLLDRCGVAGVARAWILARAKRWLPVREGTLTRMDVESADEVFLSNAVRGIVPVRALATHRYTVGPVTHRLGYTLARLGIGRSPDRTRA